MNNITALRRKPRAAQKKYFLDRRFQVYTQRDLERIPQLQRLPEEQRFAMRVLSSVLPFRANEYVVDELIDWDAVPDDPIYRLIFPQEAMLSAEHFAAMADLLRKGADKQEIQAKAREIRRELNPHPAGQLELNRPRLPNGEPINGLRAAEKNNHPILLVFWPGLFDASMRLTPSGLA